MVGDYAPQRLMHTEDMMNALKMMIQRQTTLKIRELPHPKRPIEVQREVALRVDLKKVGKGVFYKVDYLGRELLVRVTKENQLEIHELVEVD
jgi:hypothetical protein